MNFIKRNLSGIVLAVQGFLERILSPKSKTYKLLRWLSTQFIPPALKRDYGIIYESLNAYSRATSKTRPIQFIQIGSCDGVTGDPIHEFIIRDGWQGVLVEPLSYNFRLLTANYHGREGLVFVKKAVSPTAGPLRFYRLPKELPDYPSVWRQIASLEERHFRGSCAACGIAVPDDYFEDVNTITMSELAKMVDSIDVLHIDAEGIDCSLIMAMLKDTPARPKLILFESHFMEDKQTQTYVAFDVSGYEHCSSALKSAGYRLTREGRDTLAVKVE